MGKRWDAEELVEKCYEQRKNKVRYIHAERYGPLDSAGIDFIVTFPINHSANSFTIELQIKSSDTGDTIGIVLSLPQQLPQELSGKRANRMRRLIRYHQSKHPEVNCMLFVARVGKRKKEEDVIAEMWRETKKIFSDLRRCSK